MNLANPSRPRFRVRRTGDRLAIRVPARGHVVVAIAMVPFLLFWAFSEVVVMGLVALGLPFIGMICICFAPGGFVHLLWVIPFWLFMMVWLRGWTRAGKLVFRLWCWHLGGVETITVGPERLTVRLETLWFKRNREYQTADVSGLRVWADREPVHARSIMPDLSDEGRGALAFEAGERTQWFGVDLDRTEAEVICDWMIAFNPGLTDNRASTSVPSESLDHDLRDPDEPASAERCQENGVTHAPSGGMPIPLQALTPEVFPEGVRVIRFQPGRLLDVAVDSSRGEKVRIAAFSVAHWALFPALAVGLLGRLLGEWGAAIGGIGGAALGLANWLRLSRRGPYIRIDFRKRKYSLFCVAGAAWFRGLPKAHIETVFNENQWVSRTIIAGHAVATNISSRSRGDAEQPFRDFVRAFNRHIGYGATVAEGA